MVEIKTREIVENIVKNAVHDFNWYESRIESIVEMKYYYSFYECSCHRRNISLIKK